MLTRSFLVWGALALALPSIGRPVPFPQSPAKQPSASSSRTAEGGAARRATATKRATQSKASAASRRGDSANARPAAPKPEWPVKGPEPLPGAILPNKRIIAFYGNPLSTRMGILGEISPGAMLDKLDKEVAAWSRADSLVPAVPALHLIATVAQAHPGADGMYRARMSDSLIERVYGWAQRRNALLFLDIQTGKSTLRAELPRLTPFLSRPNVHLGLDPEFAMKRGGLPGKRIGTLDAADINYASEFLQQLVTEHKIPPKVLVVHRFTRPMLTNYKKIALDPRVQIVIQMDGWGSPELKKGSYVNYVYSEPVQFTGFKIFYKNDVKKQGWRLMKPADVLELHPKPVYIQYQ